MCFDPAKSFMLSSQDGAWYAGATHTFDPQGVNEKWTGQLVGVSDYSHPNRQTECCPQD